MRNVGDQVEDKVEGCTGRDLRKHLKYPAYMPVQRASDLVHARVWGHVRSPIMELVCEQDPHEPLLGEAIWTR